MDELSTLTSHDSDYRRSNIMCFTETWLTEQITDLDIEGYTNIPFDRDKQKTEKNIGGGLCMFMNRKWATNVCVRRGSF